jgi:hypothetical protein
MTQAILWVVFLAGDLGNQSDCGMGPDKTLWFQPGLNTATVCGNKKLQILSAYLRIQADSLLFLKESKK